MLFHSPTAPGRRRRLSDHYTVPLVAWTLGVSYASLSPPAGLPSLVFDVSDKLGHAAMYAVFAWLLLRAWVRSGPIAARAAVGVGLVAVAWGFYLECLQALTVERGFDLDDELANAVGALLGVLALIVWRRRAGSTSSAPPSFPLEGADA
jgi:VanZ family protein